MTDDSNTETKNNVEEVDSSEKPVGKAKAKPKAKPKRDFPQHSIGHLE